ncbi:MAG: DUF1376 domain-containing protein [Sedimentisphaerales bacterium]
MKHKKIKYVSLEAGAFLSDMVFQVMNAEERGVYCSLIFYLYENNGGLPLNPEYLKHLCNCENFEKVWEFIKRKFIIKRERIYHKRVTAELEKARLFLQGQSEKGVKGMKSRWHSDNTAITKRSEPNRSEDKGSNNSNTNSAFQSPISSIRRDTITTAELETLRFRIYDILCGIFRGRTVSDSTAIRNLTKWVKENIAAGKFEPEIFKTIVNMAVESKNGKSRKPLAVFFAQVKRELGYKDET